MEASPYYSQLIDALDVNGSQNEPIKVRYAELYRILNEMMNEITERTGLVFSGPFARLTYLVREYGVEHELYKRINSFRSLCKSLQTADVKQLEAHYKYDAKTLTDFICAVTGDAIPAELSTMLPRSVKIWKTVRIALPYMRVVVDSWDDTHILATAEDADEDIIRKSFGIGEVKYSLEDIAKAYSVTHQMISKYKAKALIQLKQELLKATFHESL